LKDRLRTFQCVWVGAFENVLTDRVPGRLGCLFCGPGSTLTRVKVVNCSARPPKHGPGFSGTHRSTRADEVVKRLGKRLISEALSDFGRQRPLYEEYGLKLTALFRELLAQNGIGFQTIEQRAKTVESLREKLGRPGKAYRSGLDDITDLCGLRIITYTLAEVSRVCELIQHEFTVVPGHSVDRGALLGPSEFGYRSRYFVVQVASSRSNLAEWKRFAKLRAEVQVRTVLEHAWAAIDHSLRYKRAADVPREQMRSLFRLSALLELADESFDRLKQQQAALKGEAQQRLADRSDTTLELNSVSYSVYAQSAPVLRELMDVALAAGLKDSAVEYGREYGELDSGTQSALITVASTQGIRTIHDLDLVLRQEKELAAPYFGQLVKEAPGHWSVSPDFVALFCLLRRDPNISKAQLVGLGWHGEVADRVIRVGAAHRTKVVDGQ